MKRTLAAAAALGTLTVGLLGLGQPVAHAADGSDSAITHLQRTKDGLKLLVSVPADSDVDLDDVAVTIDGTTATATATAAKNAGGVRRTAMLAIDTSNSMKGAKFDAAKAAALQYLSTVPSDVYVGIVTFDQQVTTDLEPTQDRAAATAVVNGLTLGGGTHLYDAVVTAVKASGKDGQRSLLVLSDGADASSTPLETATSAISDAGALVDVVAVDQAADDSALTALADAGKGQMLSADPDALAATFASEAQVLARQVVVTAQVPPSVTATQATVQVSFGDVTASAFGQVRAQGPPTVAKAASGPVVPQWAMYGGVAAFGLGIAVLLILVIPRPAPEMSAEQRVSSYTANGRRAAKRGGHKAGSDEVLSGAKTAAADLLKRSAGLEARIAARLDAAGSELKPAEWLLVHTGIAVVVALLGLLLGKGNLLLGIVFLVVGIIGPWVYLGLARSRRRKAFNRALPDTLQLISGSLAAGLSLAQSLDTVVNDGVEPVAGEFRRVLVETRLGVTLEDALEGVAERFESKDFEWVVMAIKIQRQVGGNLAELLDTVASTMREREYLRRQVSALAAEGKLSAIVLGLLPPLFVLYLCATNWDYVSPLFTDIRGLIMLLGGTLWLGVGVFWMSRLVKVEV
jgi:tight adherence protein B